MQARGLLLDIIEDRHGKKSTVITLQIPVRDWYDIIGEKTIVDAILDRIEEPENKELPHVCYQTLVGELKGINMREAQGISLMRFSRHMNR